MQRTKQRGLTMQRGERTRGGSGHVLDLRRSSGETFYEAIPASRPLDLRLVVSKPRLHLRRVLLALLGIGLAVGILLLVWFTYYPAQAAPGELFSVPGLPRF